MDETISYYSQNAEHFQQLYDSVEAESVHASWSHILKEKEPGVALDVGAGSGRDARWLASLGWKVVAVEPATALRQGASTAQSKNITWCDAALPVLASLPDSPKRYSLILLSAVWMHLPEIDRTDALSRLKDLLASDGCLVISLRFGPSDNKRPMHPVSVNELELLAEPLGLEVIEMSHDSSADELQRNDVHWRTALLFHKDEA